MSLTIHIYSFGYHFSGIPQDPTGNKGGFVFDCRCLPNPGTQEVYRPLTGLDDLVKTYFGAYPEVQIYADTCFQLVSQAVHAYIKKDYTNLFVAFGCTGGQHRSVYQAELLHEQLKKIDGVIVELLHMESERWPSSSMPD